MKSNVGANQLIAAIILGVIVLNPRIARADLSVLRADFENNPSASASMLMVRISGRISEQDVVAVSRALERVQSRSTKPVVLWAKLNSPGGDVGAAMKLGRLVRSHKGLAEVEDGGACASACVLVLAGGASRIVIGNVLIHRPYDPQDQMSSPPEQKRKYSELRGHVGDYLEEMNIPITLYDDMLRISPDKARTLTQKDLEGYGLSADDPFYSEAKDVELAKKRGISREEYARRTARAGGL